MVPTRSALLVAGAALLLTIGIFLILFLRSGSQPATILTGDSATVTASVIESSTETHGTADRSISLPVQASETTKETQENRKFEETPLRTVAETPTETHTSSTLNSSSDSLLPSSSSASFVAPVSREGWERYENALYYYALEVPADWYASEETGSTAWMATFSSFDPSTKKDANDLPGVQFDVFVQENTEGLSLTQLTEEVISQTSAVHLRQETTLGDEAAIWLEAEIPSGRTLILVTVHGTDAYTLSFTGRDAKAEEGVFQAIRESFTFS